MIYEENGHFVESMPQGGWRVFRPSKSFTHAESDSTYGDGIDGLSLAICRVMYLARDNRKGIALESSEKAASLMAQSRGHGRKMRDALADFDAEFMRA